MIPIGIGITTGIIIWDGIEDVEYLELIEPWPQS